jgi:predicted membrane protein
MSAVSVLRVSRTPRGDDHRLGGAAAAIAGPVYALAIITASVVRHALVLTTAAALGARLLPAATPPPRGCGWISWSG